MLKIRLIDNHNTVYCHLMYRCITVVTNWDLNDVSVSQWLKTTLLVGILMAQLG